MKFQFSVLLLLTSFLAQAQTKVQGVVKDKKGKGLKLVSVAIKNSYDGTVCDSLGNYKFETTETGNQIIEFKVTDYKTYEQAIDLSKNKIITVNVQLREELSELKAVTVTAGSFAAGDKKRAATVLSSIDVVTTANANADITAAVKTLPGAQQVGEQEGLFVRGGAGYETKQFVDGTYVNNPFFSGAQDIATRGRFSPFLFKGTLFSTGGYSALYGQALSSALILESIDMPEQSQVSASISSVFLGAGFQHLSKNKKSSYGLNYGYTNLAPYFAIVKQTPDNFKVPEFHNADANFRFKTKTGGMVKYYASFSTNNLGLRRPNIDDASLKNAFKLNNINWYNNLSWKENLGNGFKISNAAGFAINTDDINQQIQNAQNQATTTGLGYIDNNNFSLKSVSQTVQFKSVITKKIIGLSTINFGGEYWYNSNAIAFNGFKTNLFDNLTATFAEADMVITNDLAAKVGARAEYSSIINKWNMAPRLSLAYKTGKDAQMSIAYGDFYQKPEVQQIQLSNAALNYAKATHYMINYSKMNTNYTFRIEAFYKKYNQLVKTYPTYNNDGNGYAQGLELFWRDKKTVKNLDYWLSYSYLDTKRNYLNFPTSMQPNFAATHTASLVAKRFVLPWKTGFNFTYSYATGRPYYNIQTNSLLNQSYVKDEGKTIPYNSLSFSVNYLPNLGKQNSKTFIVLVASVNNVLNQNQVYGYNYNYNGTVKMPINPPAKQFFFVGCFISWGVDRTQDAINNNL